MKPALLPLLLAAGLGLNACAARIPGPTLSAEPLSLRYGHDAYVTVRYQGENLRLMAGPGLPVQKSLLPAAPNTTALIPRTGDLLLLARNQLLRYDRNGTPLQTVAAAGVDQGMQLDGDILISWGRAGFALYRLRQDGIDTISRIAIDDGVRSLILHRNSAWLVTSDNTLQAYSLQRPDAPQPLGRTVPGATVHALAAEGRYLYLAAGEEGIVVMDTFAEPAAREVARYHTGGVVHDLAIANGIAYIADGHNGLGIVDLSEPLNIRQLGSLHRIGDARRVRLQGEQVLLADKRGLLYLVDVGNAFVPRLKGIWPASGTVAEFAIEGNEAYSVSNGQLQELDLTAPVLPAVSAEGLNLGGSRRARIDNGLLYVADWFSGLHIYDIRDPSRPLHLGNYHTPGSAKGVWVENGVAWVGDDDQGLQVIDVSDPRQPKKIGHMPTSGLAYTMNKRGDQLFVADHRGGFYIVDIRDPANSRQLAHFKTTGKAWAIELRDRHAFVADDDGGILVVDVSDPTAPKQIGGYNPGGQAEDIVIRGNLAYCAFFDKGFYVLDISNPRAIRKLARITIPGNARGIVVDGDIAWVAAWHGGLQALDISKPEQPRIIGRLDTDGSVWGVRLAGKHAWLLDWWGGVKVADISNPRRPRLLARYHARDTLRNLAIRDDYVWQAAGNGGLQVFDIRNALNPIWVTGLDAAGPVTDLTLSRDRVWFLSAPADGQNRLHLADNSNPFYLREIASTPLPTQGRQVAWSAGQAFVLDDDGRVQAFRYGNGDWQITPLQEQQVQRILSTGEHLFIANAEHIRVYKSHRLSHPASLIRLPGPLSAFAAGQGRLLLHIEGDGFHLYGGRNSAYRPVSHYPYPGEVHELLLHDDRLLATTDRGLLNLHISDNDTLANGQLYPATEPLTALAALDDKVFFAGSPLMSSLTLLPPTPVQALAPGLARIRFPGSLPLGSYQVRGIASDGSEAGSEIINVELRRPKRPRMDPEIFKRMMKTPKK